LGDGFRQTRAQFLAVSTSNAKDAQNGITELSTKLEDLQETLGDFVSEADLLRVTASIGTQMAEFVHEIQSEGEVHLTDHCATVESNAGTGILWSEADSNYTLKALFGDGHHGIGDKRFPVSHAHENGHAKRLRELMGLQQRPTGQGRRSDQRIAVTNFLHDLRR